MAFAHALQEHWTDGKSAVVVTAESSIITQLVADLGLPGERPVNMSCKQYALALWGDELTTYLDWRDGLLDGASGSHGSVAGGAD